MERAALNCGSYFFSFKESENEKSSVVQENV